MTLPIIWRLNARSDLAEIIRYVENVNPQAARRLRQVLMESMLPISEHPYLYRQSQVIPRHEGDRGASKLHRLLPSHGVLH